MQKNPCRFSCILVLLAFASASSVAHSGIINVPGNHLEFADAIAAANPATPDTILVTAPSDFNGGRYRPFVHNKSIPIIRTYSGAITVDAADTADYAAQLTASAATVEGLTFVGGAKHTVRMTGGTLRNCRIEAPDPGEADPYYAYVLVEGSNVLIDRCVIDADNGKADAIFINGANCTVRDSRITVTGLTDDVSVAAICMDASGAIAERDTIEFVGGDKDGWGVYMYGDAPNSVTRDCWITGARYGIVLHGFLNSNPQHLAEGNVLENCTKGVRVWNNGPFTVRENTIVFDSKTTNDDGILVESTNTSATIERNLIVRADRAIRCNLSSSGVTYDNNIYDDCNAGTNCGHPGSELVQKAVTFCGSREGIVEEYSLKIDSEASRGNNGWDEQVGAYDVECAWGSLARNTTVADGSNVTVLEDVTVPSGKSLTLNSGVTVRFDEDDNGASGSSSSKNELIVDGSLTVSGTSGSRVVFKSAKATPAEGDWYVLDAGDATSQSVTYADIQHAVYGIVVRKNAASSVTNSLFSNNSSLDIVVSSTGSDSTSATITGNTITVASGSGIDVSGNASGSTIENNTITGSSTSVAGIQHITLSGSSKPALIDNVINGFTNGKAIESNAGAPVLKENEATNGKWGFYVSGGNPKLGAAADTTSDNIASGNSNSGGFFTGSSTTGTVRQSRFTGNGSGLVTKGNANPDLGTSGDYGNNIFLSNTTYCLWNQSTSGTVSAQGNYKGACTPPSTCWNGSFDLTNALCTVPAGGPELPVETVAGGHGLRSLLRVPHPNPSAGPTVLSFRLAGADENVSVGIYDVSGRLVRRFEERPYDAGEHEVFWDGTADSGRPSPSGLYFVRVRTGGATVGTTRLILAR